MKEKTESLNPLEYLSLGDCELQGLIAGRNSSLGKLASASQRLVYEIRFLALASDCESMVRPSDPELADLLARVAAEKQEHLPVVIWMATVGSPEFRALWKTHLPVEPPILTAELEVALRRLDDDAERWLDGDYAIDSGSLEASLDEIRRGTAGAHLMQWVALADGLRPASAIVRARLERRSICWQGQSNRTAEILNNVVRDRFIGVVQRSAARLSRDYHAVLPRIRALEERLAAGEPATYRAWRQTRDSVLDAATESLAEHAAALSPALRQCGLLPEQ